MWAVWDNVGSFSEVRRGQHESETTRETSGDVRHFAGICWKMCSDQAFRHFLTTMRISEGYQGLPSSLYQLPFLPGGFSGIKEEDLPETYHEKTQNHTT